MKIHFVAASFCVQHYDNDDHHHQLAGVKTVIISQINLFSIQLVALISDPTVSCTFLQMA